MLNELICYAERKIDEAAEQGEDIAVIRYWVGYADGLKALRSKIEKEDTTDARTHGLV